MRVISLPRRRFEELVADALDALPDELGRLMQNVAVVVETGDDPDLLGFYEGVPLTERHDYGQGFALPDRIVIFQDPICALCESEDEVIDEVAVTVVHEIAHHFGIDDDRLDQLGWG